MMVPRFAAALKSLAGRRPAFRGHLDEATPQRIRGWARDKNGGPPNLVLLINDKAVARFQPSLERPDLRDFARKDLGFDVQPPEALKDGDLIGVVNTGGEHLSGSPRVVTTMPPMRGDIPAATEAARANYVRSSPSDQNAIDIFKGEWTSQLPDPPGASLNAGTLPLFEDGRITWAINEFGGISGFRVLELGPLEGGHSYMLERHGASQITAIEANTRAYLRCLIAKEILGLKAVRFLCGDCVEFLRSTTEQFDLIVACGVLYHMTDPVKLISLAAQHTTRIYMWTHYWHPVLETDRRQFFSSSHSAITDGFPHTLHRQEYQGESPRFCGGSHHFSNWLSRDELMRCLAHFGFRSIRIGHEQTDHPSGPCVSLAGVRDSSLSEERAPR
jgi:hypothetical protein